jgi:hypothetical protein
VRLSFKNDAALVFLLLALIFAYFYHDSESNGNSRFGLIFAVVDQGRLRIDSYHNRPETYTDDKAYYQGHYYSDKDIGTSLVGSIFYGSFAILEWLLHFSLSVERVKYLLTFLTIGLPSALAGSLMYLLCRYISGSRLRAFVVTLAIILGTMALPFSVVFFGHQLAAALLFCAFFLIFQLRVRPDLKRPGYLFLIGLVLGLALITEYTTVLIVAPLGLYYFYAAWERQPVRPVQAVSLPALGGLIPVSILLVYNTICFDHPFSIGYQHLSNSVFEAGMSKGILGVGLPQLKVLYYLTLHPAIGLFWQSPVLLMSLVGFASMLRDRRFRPEAAVIAVSFTAFLLLNSGYYMWWGGYSAGPRHLIPALPFLGIPLLFVPRRLFPVVILLAILSILQMFVIAASDVIVPDEFMKRIGELSYFQYSAIYSHCLPMLLHGEFTWNLGQQVLGLRGWMSLAPVLLCILGAVAFFILMDRPASSSELMARGHYGD